MLFKAANKKSILAIIYYILKYYSNLVTTLI